MRIILTSVAVLWLLLAAASADAYSRSQNRKLDEIQQAYANAIRWSEFDRAWEFVDPQYRGEHPLTDLQLERYRQLQVSSYRERSRGVLPDGTVTREIEVGAINRNTQAERTIRYSEGWRWDEAGKRWWQTLGLPDFWQGQ
ncbi:hypothetical protein [Stenotrophomonas sp. MMGLT7]|uniref:hypothetical protein n=1 Tax=Stenotrophomonas sp. MMGLT7 TaxID=2901227 RepID=UPI001E4F349D|nr:hypothetical protein [Stenotrophomonas sp. MMGLT7]MCD7099894.1 hypothetical protein [Stenotrophomonas sp. MMGLT7]